MRAGLAHIEEGGPLEGVADRRRAEAPMGVAFALLVGGLAGSFLHSAMPVAWALGACLLIAADVEIYRRLSPRVAELEPRLHAGLAGWAFAMNAYFAAMPAALMILGGPAALAVGACLPVAYIAKQAFRISASRAVALAAGAPHLLVLLAAPALSSLSAGGSLPLGLMTSLSGAALLTFLAYVYQERVEAQRELKALRADRQAEAFMYNVLADQGMTCSVCLLDRDFNIQLMTPGMRRELRMEDGDFVGRGFFDLFAWLPADWRARHKRALEGESYACAEEKMPTPHGERYLRWEVRPWRTPSGAIAGVIVGVYDITALVEAREAALAGAERLKLAIDGKAIIFEIDFKRGTTQWFGDSEAIYGRAYTQEDSNLGGSPFMIEEEREMVADHFRRAIAGEVATLTHRIRKADGSIAWLEANSRRLVDAEGNLNKLIVMVIDVTEQKNSEKRFLQSMARAERVLRAKRAMLLDQELGPVETPRADDGEIGVAKMHERLAALLEEMRERDVAMAKTMESLRQSREEAEQANILKSQFVANMSHELRTPLNAMLGYAEMLMEDAEAEERESDLRDLERILASGKQLLRLINEVLDLSKIEAGKLETTISEFDVAALVVEAADLVRPVAEKNGNTIKLELEPDLPTVRGDSFKLNQCLLNLLSNACKFTQDGEINVTARKLESADGEGQIELAVRDSGIGMSDDQLKTIFQPFAQADSSISKRYGGTGLGLAITQRMMRLMGGDIEVESAPDQGSTFRLRTPVNCEEAKATLAAADAQDNPLVLLIDGDAGALDVAKRSLPALGFKVVGVVDGGSGLRAAKAMRPALIVMEADLPDMSAWDVMAALDLSEETSAIPVIVCSPRDQRAEAMDSGACEFLQKPVSGEILAAAAARFARLLSNHQPDGRNTTFVHVSMSA